MLSEGDINDIASHDHALNNLRAFLFFVSPETFHAYCNLLIRNKSGRAGFSSRKLFRTHCVELFKSIATHGAFTDPGKLSVVGKHSFANALAEDHPHRVAEDRLNSDTERIELSLDVFGHGLRGMGKRWNMLDLEELSSLGYLVDLDKDGHVSWEDFYHFNSSIFDCLQRHTTETARFMDVIFTDLCHAVHVEAEESLGKHLSTKLKEIISRYMHAQEVLEERDARSSHARRYAPGGLGRYGKVTDLAMATPPLLSTIIVDSQLYHEAHASAAIEGAGFDSPRSPRSPLAGGRPTTPSSVVSTSSSGTSDRRPRRRLSLNHTTHFSGLHDRKTLRKGCDGLHAQSCLRILSHIIDVIATTGNGSSSGGGSVAEEWGGADAMILHTPFKDSQPSAIKGGATSPKFLDVSQATEAALPPGEDSTTLKVPSLNRDGVEGVLAALQENAAHISAKLSEQARSQETDLEIVQRVGDMESKLRELRSGSGAGAGSDENRGSEVDTASVASCSTAGAGAGAGAATMSASTALAAVANGGGTPNTSLASSLATPGTAMSFAQIRRRRASTAYRALTGTEHNESIEWGSPVKSNSPDASRHTPGSTRKKGGTPGSSGKKSKSQASSFADFYKQEKEEMYAKAGKKGGILFSRTKSSPKDAYRHPKSCSDKFVEDHGASHHHSASDESPNKHIGRHLPISPRMNRLASMRMKVLSRHLNSDGNIINEVTQHADVAEHATEHGSPTKGMRLNMGIFKSPRHYPHPNRNVFDEKSFAWVPTVLTGKYTDRFVTTKHLMEGPKVNAMLAPREPGMKPWSAKGQ